VSGANPGSHGPLAGLRVLELGSLIAAPFATRLLADLGAEVLKVEAPGKLDPMREWGAVKEDGHSLWWPIQARSKKLLTLDLRSERGQELAVGLAKGCDVLFENFRPGTMERWNLGPDVLLAANPALVYTRISGYGQDGPYASRPGFASAGEAIGGLRFLNGFPGGPPPRTGLSLGDSLCAMFAVIGTLAALEHSRKTGEGQVVDAAISESCMALLESVLPEYDRFGVVREPTGTAIANNAPSNIYKSKDGSWMVIAANSANLWPRLCEEMGMAELIDDPRFATHDDRGRNQDELDEIIGAWAAGVEAEEIDRRLTAAGVVCGPVHTVADIFADPQFRARQMLVPVEDENVGELIGPGVVPKLSGTPAPTSFKAPSVPGGHNREVYAELLGLDGAEIDELESGGVI